MVTTWQDQAREALRLAVADPARSAALASAVAEQARATNDIAATAIAERALGLAALHTDDLDTAMRHLRAAITLGRRARSPRVAAEARMTLAYALNGRGRSRQALREISTAVHDLAGVQKARAEAQRGAILQQLGRFDEALVSYRAALRALRRANDQLWIQRVLLNRSVAHGYRQEFTAAAKDLREAENLCEQLELGLSAGLVWQNRGWLSTMRGDVPTALHYLDLAEQRFRALGARLGLVLTDRCEVLLSARLVSEARQAGELAVQAFERERQQNALPETRLLLARAAALDGDLAGAALQARQAVSEFTRQQRPRWTALARFALLSARLAGSDRPHVGVRQVARTADALSAGGWPAAALEARLLAGQLALERGWISQGCEILEQASHARSRGPATLRSRAWQATALLRLAKGNRSGAVIAVRAGLNVIDEYRATLGATDLRAYASGHRRELCALGLGMALDSGGARGVLAWAERGRARHLLSRPARPPSDPVLDSALTELRATVAQIYDPHSSDRRRAVLRARQAALERKIRDYCRTRPGGETYRATSHVSVRSLSGALGDAALVEFVQVSARLHAVTVAGGRVRLHQLGPIDAVRDLVDLAAFALRRLAGRRTSPASRDAAIAVLRHCGPQLDAQLLRPLAVEIKGRPLVLVPTGPLQSVPWSILPSCAGLPVTVSPSAALWYAASCSKPAQTREAAVAAGPGLPGARAEAESVAAIHKATCLAGSGATVHAVAAALNRASLVHLAAHGRIRADNPLFSSLQLADGPLTVYDLERLDRVPQLVVLAACDSGRPVVCAGDELLGLGATLIALGTQQLVASVVPIPDAETAPLMIAFHRLIAAGHRAADALGQAQRQAVDGGAAAVAAGAGFICIGAG